MRPSRIEDKQLLVLGFLGTSFTVYTLHQILLNKIVTTRIYNLLLVLCTFYFVWVMWSSFRYFRLETLRRRMQSESLQQKHHTKTHPHDPNIMKDDTTQEKGPTQEKIH